MNLQVRSILFMFLWLVPVWQASAECNSALGQDLSVDRYELLDNQWVVDKKTGLMWARCPMGYRWGDSNCERELGSNEMLIWPEALQQANSANLGGFDDWRLPNRKELESIVERRCANPAINQSIFVGIFDGLFWTSSPNDGRGDASWVVDFATGAHRNLIKTEPGYVRLVRDY